MTTEGVSILVDRSENAPHSPPWQMTKAADIARLTTVPARIDFVIMDVEALTALVDIDLVPFVTGLGDEVRLVVPDAVWSALATADSEATAHRLVDASRRLFPKVTLAPTLMDMRRRWLHEMGANMRAANEGMTQAAAMEVVEQYQRHSDRDIVLVLSDAAFGRTTLLLPDRTSALSVGDLMELLGVAPRC